MKRLNLSAALMVPALLLLALATIPIDQSQAQIFRRYRQAPSYCPDGVCCPPVTIYSTPIEAIPAEPEVVEAPQETAAAADWYSRLTSPRGRRISAEEEAIIRSWAGRAVRIINGNSCGTGSLCGRDGSSIYILTNAHVASTRIGNRVQCEALLADKSATEKFPAFVVESAYSSRTSTDWALLKADVSFMVGIEPIKLSKTSPDGDLAATWGCPRCEIPSGQLIETTSLGSIWYWDPNSIGGQSGSAVVQDGLQKGLLTWTINGKGAGQLTETIYNQSARKNTDGPARPDGLVPVGPLLPELEEGYHAEADIGSFPIWEDSVTPPGTGPPTTPGDSLEPDEKRLIDFLRDLRRRERLDYAALITLIIEILKLFNSFRS